MKTSKSKTKVVIMAIIIFLILNILACAIITKIIYDSSFDRYDGKPEDSILRAFDELNNTKEQHIFLSGENKLSGYLFDSDIKDVLIILVPGMNASHEEYLPVIGRFREEGFGVFTFDPTGTCSSEGTSNVGFEQELVDLNYALDYVDRREQFGFDKTVLFGHSRGGYAVSCVSLMGHEADAIVSVSGINSAMEGIMEPAVDMMGNFAYANYPMLWIYQLILFDKSYVEANAVEAYDKASIPTLVIHGSQDETIALEEYSIYSHMDEIENTDLSDEVDYILSDEDGCNGHVDILHNYEAEANQKLMDEIVNFILEAV